MIDAVKLLREQAKDPAANAVFHMFATRKRARNQVTIEALSQRMEKEGYHFEHDKYRRILKSLGELGFGHTELDKKGRVRAIKGMKFTLQSIGLAALQQQEKLKTLVYRNKYKQLAKMVKETPTLDPFPVSLIIMVNGKPLTLRVPKDMTEQEIADIIVRFTGRRG